MFYLLNSQKADLFAQVQAGTLPPGNFFTSPAKDHAGHSTGFLLSYQGTSYQFSIRPSEVEFRLDYSPGTQWYQEGTRVKNWSEVLTTFALWLKNLERELKAPDPWESVARFSALVSMAPAKDAANTPLTYAEWESISKGLSAIRDTLLKQAHGDASHRQLIETRIEVLTESGKTMARKEWLISAIGSLVTIAAGMNLSPEATRAVFQLLKNTVAGIVQFVAIGAS